MIGSVTESEAITAKALLIALSVLVLVQIGAAIFWLVMFYGLAGNHLSWMFVLMSGMYAMKYALVSSAAAFVVAFVVFVLIAVLRRERPKII